MLAWISDNYSSTPADVQLVLWGQSIGAGVGCTAAAEYLHNAEHRHRPQIAGLILETPFVSIRDMLAALYPQRWLPYRYLWPFLRSHWNSEKALQSIASTEMGWRMKILLLAAAKDEVVPATEAEKLHDVCLALSLDVIRHDVVGALHAEASMKGKGPGTIARFVVDTTT